jgi:hypothetical protein
MKTQFIIVSLLWLVMNKTGLADPCKDEKLIAETSGVISPSGISPWSFEAGNLKLTPDQLLPDSFLQKIEEKLGPVIFSENTMLGGKRIVLNYTTKKQVSVATVWFTREGNSLDALTIDDVSIQDPTIEFTNADLATSQYRPGAPISVFLYAVKQIQKIAKAGGFNRYRGDGSENYAVAMLYQKAANMKPEGEISERYHAMLKRYFEYAKHEADEQFRVTSLDEFVKLTGTYHRDNISRELQNLWAQYIRTKVLPPEFQLIKLNDGLEIGVVYKSKLYFIDNVDPNRPLFDWYHVNRKKLMSLTSNPL